jgi:hypothetical protein
MIWTVIYKRWFWKVLIELVVLDFATAFAEAYEPAKEEAIRDLSERRRRR